MSIDLSESPQREAVRGGQRASEAADSTLEKALADVGNPHPPGHPAPDGLHQRAPSRSAGHRSGSMLFAAAQAESEGTVSADRWMVSYADFITLMFVFFLALYTLLPKETHEELLGRVVHHEQTKTAPQAATPASHVGAPEQLLSEIEEALAPLIDSGDVRARRVPRGVQVEIRDTALFEVGTAELNQRARNILAQVARIFTARPNLLQVEGHTDPSPIQSALYPSNWELSAARASRVVRLLQEYGLRASRLSAVGMADTKPIGDNATAEGRARNRRVAIIVIAP